MIKAIIWSKENCYYCHMAKEILDDKNIPYEERNLSDGSWTKEQLLIEVPDAKTVPQIFIDGNYIGGYDELSNLFFDI